MPKIPINYQNTIIYKFVCDDVNIKDVYVGATTDMIRRKAQHKYRCTNSNDKCHNLKIYFSMRSNGGWENWTMLEVEKYPCNNLMESNIRERYWLEQLNSNLNKVVPSRTDKEYREDHKEQAKEYLQEYYKNNKEQAKEYYINNKEKIKEYSKEYYNNNNKDNNKLKKYECVCGCNITIIYKSHHNKTKKHLSYIQNNVNILDV